MRISKRSRLQVMIRTSLVLCISGWLIGCSSTKHDLLPLEDSSVPIPKVYNVHGELIEGYQGYSDGYVNRTMKACNEFLDEKGIP